MRPSEFEQHQFTTRLDGRLTSNNTLSGTFFFSNFPALDSFPDPSSLISPFVLRRADRNRTLAISDQHIFSPTLINEFVFGYFSLNNTRTRRAFPTSELTSEAIGIGNPALLFDDSPGTRRLGHYRPARTMLTQFSFGGPNDSFNQRKQQTFSIANNITWIRNNHTFRFGADFKRHQYDSSSRKSRQPSLRSSIASHSFSPVTPPKQTRSLALTEVSFRFRDYSGYIADDWKVSKKLTLNLGLRYELFMWPEEKDGRIGNFDFAGFDPCFTQSGGSLQSATTLRRDLSFPRTCKRRGSQTSTALSPQPRAGNNHTLNDQDQHRATRWFRVLAAQRQPDGDSRRLRPLLRSPIGRVYQHDLQ